MPTYEYECTTCKQTFEMFQSMTAEPIRKCPHCGSRVKRLIGAGAGILFKGSGFYETDYKRKSPAASEKKADSESSAKQGTARSSGGRPLGPAVPNGRFGTGSDTSSSTKTESSPKAKDSAS